MVDENDSFKNTTFEFAPVRKAIVYELVLVAPKSYIFPVCFLIHTEYLWIIANRFFIELKISSINLTLSK